MADQRQASEILKDLPRPGGPGAALWRAANRWQRVQRELLEPFGLTPVQCLLLSGLDDLTDRGPVTQADLSTHCGVDGMTTSQQIRELERNNLVRRRPHARDRRAVSLALTAQGGKLLHRVSAPLAETERAFFGVLGADADAFSVALGLLTGEKPRRRVAAVYTAE